MALFPLRIIIQAQCVALFLAFYDYLGFLANVELLDSDIVRVAGDALNYLARMRECDAFCARGAGEVAVVIAATIAKAFSTACKGYAWADDDVELFSCYYSAAGWRSKDLVGVELELLGAVLYSMEFHAVCFATTGEAVVVLGGFVK